MWKVGKLNLREELQMTRLASGESASFKTARPSTVITVSLYYKKSTDLYAMHKCRYLYSCFMPEHKKRDYMLKMDLLWTI